MNNESEPNTFRNTAFLLVLATLASVGAGIELTNSADEPSLAMGIVLACFLPASGLGLGVLRLFNFKPSDYIDE